jgi:hypothetical protein
LFLLPFGAPRRSSAVHPASTVRHCRLLAWPPGRPAVAQRSYELARLSLVQAQAARFADTATLFQSLSGGWWNRTDVIPDKPKPGIIEVITGTDVIPNKPKPGIVEVITGSLH